MSYKNNYLQPYTGGKRIFDNALYYSVAKNIHSDFRVGTKLSRKAAKLILRIIYEAHGIIKTPLHTDLLNFLQYNEYRTSQSRFIKITSHTK